MVQRSAHASRGRRVSLELTVIDATARVVDRDPP
jgi:hypothetical protein